MPRAEFDVQHIFEWLVERSPEGARRWWFAFEEVQRRLAHQPEMYPLAPESERTGRDIRQILFRTRRGRYYRILFLVSAQVATILRVRGPGQPELLDDEIV